MTRALCIVLGLALAAPARAADPVELEPGQPAPFRGALVDLDYATMLRDRRVAAELARDELGTALTDCRGRLAAAESDAGQGGLSTGAVITIAVVAAAVAGALAFVGGVKVGAAVTK